MARRPGLLSSGVTLIFCALSCSFIGICQANFDVEEIGTTVAEVIYSPIARQNGKNEAQQSQSAEQMGDNLSKDRLSPEFLA